MDNKENTQPNGAKKSLNATAGTANHTEFSNPTAILKLRMSCWVQNNRDKKHLMDVYTRNVGVIEDAFTQIREATGIASI